MILTTKQIIELLDKKENKDKTVEQIIEEEYKKLQQQSLQ